MPGEFKIAGCCTICDEHCFEVTQVYEAHERTPGEPKAFGRPLPGATRISFMQLDGMRCDMTFCERCARDLNPGQYTEIWRKVIRSWLRQVKEPYPDWLPKQFNNALAAEMGRKLWTDMT